MSREINIKPQPGLGLVRTFNITTNGIRYRLFRASITVVVITVAVAFLMSIVAESLVKQAVAREAGMRLREYRQLALWLTRLNTPASLRGILGELSAAAPGDAAWAEAARFGRLAPDEIETLHRESVQAVDYLEFFEKLDYGRLRLLTGGRNNTDVFDFLAGPEAFRNFETHLADMQTLRFPTSTDVFRRFLDAWDNIKLLTLRVREGHSMGISMLAGNMGSQVLLQRMSEADGAFGQLIREAGFELSAATATTLAAQAVEARLEASLAAGLDQPRIRQDIAARIDILPQELTLDELWKLLARTGHAEWYGELLQSANLLSESNPAAIHSLARRKLEETRLVQGERISGQLGGGMFGLGERMGWLVLLSLVVCVVGIANAMLMSVTERYREIATFKCLGALDGSIMLIFVIEAAILGSVGGLLGAFSGAILGFGRMALSYGSLALEALPWTVLLFSILFAIFTGIVLAALASVYPAFKAARLAPMEAMRIE